LVGGGGKGELILDSKKLLYIQFNLVSQIFLLLPTGSFAEVAFCDVLNVVYEKLEENWQKQKLWVFQDKRDSEEKSVRGNEKG